MPGLVSAPCARRGSAPARGSDPCWVFQEEGPERRKVINIFTEPLESPMGLFFSGDGKSGRTLRFPQFHVIFHFKKIKLGVPIVA